VNELLTARAAADPRIRFVRSAVPLGISGASNKAAEQAQGEYLGFLDHDDKLPLFALERVAAVVVDCDCDLLYTDEDRIAVDGRRVQPIFRPDWSPDLLDSCMYMGHFLVVSRAAWRRVAGLRPECDGAQDYDLALRVSEGGSKVVHIPEVLYHWRLHPGSTSANAGSKPATHAAGRLALQSAMERRARAVRIEDGNIPNRYHVKPAVSGSPLASIVICSRNAAVLSRCLRAIENNTSWPHREIVVVQHRTRDNSAMNALLDGVECTRVPFAGAFNFARMNNAGAAAAHGEVLVFMNDDVTPLTPEWLELLVGHAMRPGIGAAGAKLLYPSGAIQHAGMAIGIMDGAGHPLRGTAGSPYWPWVECTRNVSAVTGACLAIRKRLFEESGGFDSQFPVNYNDVDLCLRLRASGFEIICDPAVTLRHDECRTRMPGTTSDEREIFLERWSGLLERGDCFYHPALTRDREDAGLTVE
jgi:GT2 family glycosyltransferase